jgi:hypothetical protein
MRSDMAKVIVERPRHCSRMRDKHRKGRQRDLQRLGLDWLKRECIRTTHKSFNEHLAPLRRYLDDQVGRPWDEVHAEIRRHIRADSVVQKHVLTHVDGYVETNVLDLDGVACHGAGWLIGRPITWSWYVCPRTGLLRRVDRRDTKYGRRARRDAVSNVPKPVRVDDRHVCRVAEGRWWLVEVRRLVRTKAESDAAWQECVRKAVEELGAPLVEVGRRLLTKREMEQLPVPIDLWKQRRWWTKPRKATRA